MPSKIKRAGAAATSVAAGSPCASPWARRTGCPSLPPGRPACPCRSAATFYKASSTGSAGPVNRLRDQGRGARREGRRGEAGSRRKVTAIVGNDFELVTPKKPGVVTFEDFAMQWVKGELAALHPDHVDRKRSAYGDLCMLRKYVFPVVGETPIADVTLEDYERVMGGIAERALPKKLKRASRWAIAQVMRRVLGLAEYPAKLIERNPIPDNAMPNKRQDIALNWNLPVRRRPGARLHRRGHGAAGDRFQQPGRLAQGSTWAARSEGGPRCRGGRGARARRHPADHVAPLRHASRHRPHGSREDREPPPGAHRPTSVRPHGVKSSPKPGIETDLCSCT